MGNTTDSYTPSDLGEAAKTWCPAHVQYRMYSHGVIVLVIHMLPVLDIYRRPPFQQPRLGHT